VHILENTIFDLFPFSIRYLVVYDKILVYIYVYILMFLLLLSLLSRFFLWLFPKVSTAHTIDEIKLLLLTALAEVSPTV